MSDKCLEIEKEMPVIENEMLEMENELMVMADEITVMKNFSSDIDSERMV